MPNKNDPAEIKKRMIEVCTKINKQHGDGTTYTLGHTGNLEITRWSTGIEDLDNIIGGGMPCGRSVEVFGAEGAGKTSLCYHLLARQALSVVIPIEGTFDAKRAKLFGNSTRNLVVCRARYGEDALNFMSQFIRTGVPLICLDSIAACTPYEEIEKMVKAINKGTDFDSRIGGIARLFGKYLHDLSVQIELYGTTLIFTNQLRDKIGGMPTFGANESTPGGRQLKHEFSLRLKTARKAWIEIPNKNPANVAAQERVGMIQKIRVEKSKVSNPFGECEVPMFFDRGYVSFSEVETIRKELMKESREKYKC